MNSKMFRNPVLAALFPSKEKFWPNIISGMMASFSYATAGMILKAENLNKQCLHPANTHNRGFTANLFNTLRFFLHFYIDKLVRS